MRDGNLMMEDETRKHGESIMQMKTFHHVSIKTFPHTSLNTLKGVIRSKELSLATPEEISSALGGQGVSDYRRISIRRNGGGEY